MKTVKFKFYLKNGKVFDYVMKLDEKRFEKELLSLKTTFNSEDSLILDNSCIIRTSEVAVVEWEVIE